MLASKSAPRAVALASALAAVLFLTACDSGIPLESTPDEVAAVFCESFRTCSGDLTSRTRFGGADCEESFAAQFRNTSLPTWMELIERGTVTYDAAAAGACVDAVRAQGCDFVISAGPAACTELFIGTVEPGGSCAATEECLGDAYCDGVACPGTRGTCVMRKANGAACDFDGECTAGLLCEDGVCGVPGSSSGGPCGGPTSFSCPLDEACVGETDEAAGTCTPLSAVLTGAEGETCDAIEGSPLCRSGLSCALIGGDATGAVFECRARVAAASPCQVAFPSMCPDDQYCDASPTTGSFDGTCVPLPTEGQACADSFEGECAPGLECNTTETGSTCVRLRDNGQPCADDGECYSFNCQSGACAAPETCAP